KAYPFFSHHASDDKTVDKSEKARDHARNNQYDRPFYKCLFGHCARPTFSKNKFSYTMIYMHLSGRSMTSCKTSWGDGRWKDLIGSSTGMKLYRRIFAELPVSFMN